MTKALEEGQHILLEITAFSPELRSELHKRDPSIKQVDVILQERTAKLSRTWFLNIPILGTRAKLSAQTINAFTVQSPSFQSDASSHISRVSTPEGDDAPPGYYEDDINSHNLSIASTSGSEDEEKEPMQHNSFIGSETNKLSTSHTLPIQINQSANQPVLSTAINQSAEQRNVLQPPTPEELLIESLTAGVGWSVHWCEIEKRRLYVREKRFMYGEIKQFHFPTIGQLRETKKHWDFLYQVTDDKRLAVSSIPVGFEPASQSTNQSTSHSVDTKDHIQPTPMGQATKDAPHNVAIPPTSSSSINQSTKATSSFSTKPNEPIDCMTDRLKDVSISQPAHQARPHVTARPIDRPIKTIYRVWPQGMNREGAYHYDYTEKRSSPIEQCPDRAELVSNVNCAFDRDLYKEMFDLLQTKQNLPSDASKKFDWIGDITAGNDYHGDRYSGHINVRDSAIKTTLNHFKQSHHHMPDGNQWCLVPSGNRVCAFSCNQRTDSYGQIALQFKFSCQQVVNGVPQSDQQSINQSYDRRFVRLSIHLKPLSRESNQCDDIISSGLLTEAIIGHLTQFKEAFFGLGYGNVIARNDLTIAPSAPWRCR